MTGNATQASLDAVDLMGRLDPDKRAAVKMRLLRGLNSMFFFAFGCATGILSYFHIGFWCLIVSVIVGTACIILADC
jgi:hypothetical protein